STSSCCKLSRASVLEVGERYVLAVRLRSALGLDRWWLLPRIVGSVLELLEKKSLLVDVVLVHPLVEPSREAFPRHEVLLVVACLALLEDVGDIELTCVQ